MIDQTLNFFRRPEAEGWPQHGRWGGQGTRCLFLWSDHDHLMRTIMSMIMRIRMMMMRRKRRIWGPVHCTLQYVWISLIFRTLEDDLGTEWCCNVACPVAAEVLEQEKCPVSKTAIYKDMRIWGYVVALYWDALASKMPQSAEQRYEADTSIHFIFANHSAHHTQAFQYISSSIISSGKAKVCIKVSISLNAHF